MKADLVTPERMLLRWCWWEEGGVGWGGLPLPLHHGLQDSPAASQQTQVVRKPTRQVDGGERGGVGARGGEEKKKKIQE